MMFDLASFAKEVHQNAVEHGFWDEPRSMAVIRSLIHSEWTEALEESRAGRPMVWHACNDPADNCPNCESNTDCPCKLDAWEQDCPAYDQKPEGIAVELIDGCIRILDWMEWRRYGRYHSAAYWEAEGVRLASELKDEADDLGEDGLISVGMAVDLLHKMTARAVVSKDVYSGNLEYHAMCALGYAFWWVRIHSMSPEVLIQQKHRYNKTRPYKHGKKF